MNIIPIFLSMQENLLDILGDLRYAPETLKETLPKMAFGMGGIFLALLVIYIFSLLLQVVFPVEKSQPNEQGKDLS